MFERVLFDRVEQVNLVFLLPTFNMLEVYSQPC